MMLGVVTVEWFWFVLIHFCFGYFGRICCKLEWLSGVGISMKEVKFMEYLLEGHFWSCLLQLEVCEVNSLAFCVPLVILSCFFCDSCWFVSFLHMNLFIYISSATAIIECYYYLWYLYNCLRQRYGSMVDSSLAPILSVATCPSCCLTYTCLVCNCRWKCNLPWETCQSLITSLAGSDNAN